MNAKHAFYNEANCIPKREYQQNQQAKRFPSQNTNSYASYSLVLKEFLHHENTPVSIQQNQPENCIKE